MNLLESIQFQMNILYKKNATDLKHILNNNHQ